MLGLDIFRVLSVLTVTVLTLPVLIGNRLNYEYALLSNLIHSGNQEHLYRFAAAGRSK